MSDFVHLHLHTEYSLLDGACRIKDIPEAVIAAGHSAVAVTDHGNMYGVMQFYRTCKAKGVKPIIGCEVYVAPGSRFDRVAGREGGSHHLVLLCENDIGYRNLIYMVSKAFTEGFYSRPRIDLDLLKHHSEGLIALSACLSGEIPSALSAGDRERAEQIALTYKQIFGKDHFYIELQNHGIAEQRQILPELYSLAKELDIPVVATNDVHYLRKSDARAQTVLMCIQTNTTMADGGRPGFETEEFYYKSTLDMQRLFGGFEGAIENTVKIADMCNVELEHEGYVLPSFPLNEGENAADMLRLKTYEGLERLVSAGRIPADGYTFDDYLIRADYELGVIHSMGYDDYFLIVSDYVGFAKSADIPVGPGRGSGCGSLVAWCTSITDIDPLRYDLFFERFLNPERVSMPDFDIDFCYVRRQEVIDYVIRKYGADHVAQIVTFGTMAARGAVRDVGRVLGLPYNVVDEVAKAIPNELKITIDKALRASEDLKTLYATNDDVKRLIDIAKQVEGMPRHASTHAAGVVITRDPVSSYVPLAVNDESVVTQFTMVTLENLGLLKMDFLGLRTLTVIDDAVKLIKRTNPDFDIDKITLDDEETFEMLSQGRTDAVFQYESAGMRSVLSRLKPQSLEDLIAVISLYRPGPADSIDTYIHNRHNPQDTKYKSELLRDILDVTYGCMVYQEQVMEICRKLAGYSYGRADLVRRAMSKKKLDVMEKERHNFIYGLKNENGDMECPGCLANGVSVETANDIFDEMSNFAKYAFNKSHAAAYAFVSYQTAWLKCHYPCELLAATLTSVLDSSTKVSNYIAEATRLGIKVLSPNVNSSFEGFTVKKGAIRFGLLAIKNLGRGFIKTIIDNREQGGKYTDFYSFCKRVYSKEFNKRAVESLIKCGALDGMGLNRNQMLHMLPSVIADLDADKNKNVIGQIGFFDEDSGFSYSNEFVAPDIEEMPYRELLSLEKDITGLYISGHPMDEYKDISAKIKADSISEILDSDGTFGSKYKDNSKVRLYGIISKIEKRTTKNSSTMCFVTLEDLTASIECIVFSRQYAERVQLLQGGNIVLINGRLSMREDREPSVVCETIEPNPKNILKETAKPEKKQRKGIFLRLESEKCPEITKINTLIDIFGGGFPVYAFFKNTGKYERIGFVNLNEPMCNEFKTIIGDENVVVRR